MKWRSVITGIACAAAVGITGVPGATARYLVVLDESGAYDDCTGDYDVTSWMLASSHGAVLARGLDRAIGFADLSGGDSGVVWQARRDVVYGDLRTGAVRPLVTLARGAEELAAAVGPHGRTAIVSDDRSHVTLVGRHGGHLVRHTFRAGYDESSDLGLSHDGRFAWYTGSRDGVRAVRSLRTGRGMLLRTDGLAWAPARDRLAYVQGDHLLVLDVPTGHRSLDVQLTTAYGLGQPQWSPDGRFIAVDAFVVDVAAGHVVPLPSTADAWTWRPRHGHQLTRLDRSGGGDLVDVGRATVLWQRPHLNAFAWDPGGHWLAGDDKLMTAAGRSVPVPRSFAVLSRISSTAWLAAGQLWFGGRRSLRVAQAPRWRPRPVLTAPAGHHLTATEMFAASPAGIAMLAHRFGGRAHAADCVFR